MGELSAIAIFYAIQGIGALVAFAVLSGIVTIAGRFSSTFFWRCFLLMAAVGFAWWLLKACAIAWALWRVRRAEEREAE